MIATAKHKSGSSGSCLGYMLGDMLEKDQQVRVIGYNGFALSHLKIEEIEKVPTTDEERKDHKTKVWKIADSLSRIFDARAALADYRVNDPFEDYVISCTDGERERLRRVPTAEERKEYKMKELKDGETDDRTLEQILLDEFLAKIGVHGKIEKKLRRKSKKDGKKYTVKEIVEREAMFMAVAHDGTAHPHMHVLTARPDADGKVNDTRNERHRIAATVQALSKKYNLSLKLEGYEVDLEKTNEGYATRVRMRDAVKEACQTASSHEELYDLLAEKDMTPTWWVDADTAEDCGMTFTMKDKRGKKHTFSGTQLDRSCLTYSQVEAALARNLAARKAQEEAAQEAVQQEQKDILDGYRSAVLPVGNQIYDLKKSANELYKESKESGIAVSAATADVYKQLTATWEQYDDFNSQISDAKDRADTVMAICGILTCLNPIVGLTVMFLAGIAEDIHRSSLIEQKKKLLAKVNSLRGELTALEEEKAVLKIVKQERLQQYLDAKDMYQEYRNSLQIVDREVSAIESELRTAEKRDYIRKYTQSDKAKNLLAYINRSFDETHYSLVSGPLVETDKGMRWKLYTDGYRGSGRYDQEIYHKHDPAPQEHGESYVDFSFNEKGHLIATVECDPQDYYTYGISGVLNIETGEGSVVRRGFRGTAEEERRRRQKIQDNYAKFQGAAEKKPKKNTGPKPGH